MSARAKPPTFSLAQLRQKLGKKLFDPVYVIEGEEALLASEAVDAIVEAALPPAGRDFNLDLYAGDDEGARQFLAQARAYPFLSERRVVVVRRFEKILWRDERALDAFLGYLRDPPASTILVLVATKLDRRTTLAKDLERLARVVGATLDEAELPAWVQARFAARGLQPTSAACDLLVQLAGPGLLGLANEIDKVGVRYADRKHVDTEEIADTVGRYRQIGVFAVTEFFRPDRMAEFLAALSQVLATQDELISVVGALAWQVKTVLRVKLLQEKGIRNPNAMLPTIRAQYKSLPSLIQQASAFTKPQLILWQRNLQRADLQMKSVRLPQRLILERALVNSFLGQELN